MKLTKKSLRKIVKEVLAETDGYPQILKKNKGTSYFLGGIYDHEDLNIFENIYECGEKGLNNPKKELLSATNKLISQIKI